MADESLRRTIAAAIRTVIEEGLQKAEDPIAYLHAAAEEVGQLVRLFEEERGPSGHPDGARIRAILAEEVGIAARDMIRRLRH